MKCIAKLAPYISGLKFTHKNDGGKFVTVKASNFNKAQKLSTNGWQRFQYQSLKTLEFQ
jgi:hypothetical protein